MIGMRSRRILGGLLAGLAGIVVLSGGALTGVGADQTKSGDEHQAALAAFSTVQKVLQHPRCQNCHIPGDAPLQFDAGLTHAQNVKRGLEGKGVPGLGCATCHATKNPPASYGANMPPGAPAWNLPPPDRKMVFINLPAADLCATVKDPKRNGGKDFAALLEHVSHDKLVLWGWDPGVGRTPVSVPHEEFVAAFKTWLDAGAPCPEKTAGAAAR